MNTILRTEAFDLWLKKLKDPRGKARIIERIRSAEITSGIVSLSGEEYQKCVFTLAQAIECISLAS